MIDIEFYREYCLRKMGVTEDTPFDDDVLVFKVGGKIFLLCSISQFSYVNMKCDPEYAVDLRERFGGITPGYHMNKKHWNSVATDGSVPADLFFKLIDQSYDLIVNSLPKKVQAELKK
ncbi:MAG: MmcQ/YjbR family DNA-binding protein [Flavobacteriales bacterium]